MSEQLHPDVYVEEVPGTPTVSGASTSTTGFVGTALKGPTDRAALVTSYSDFVRQFGEGYADSFLEDAVFLAFANGLKRGFVGRVAGAGAAKAAKNLASLGGVPTPGSLTSGNTGPYNLEPAQTLVIAIDGGSNQTFTFAATRASRPGGSPTLPPTNATTLLVKFDGGSIQTVIFDNSEADAAALANQINSQITGGRAVVNGSNVDIQSDTRGSGSSVQITGGTGLVAIGHTVGTTSGTGNVVNIDAVTVAEVLTVITGLTGAASVNDSNSVKITSATTGTLSSVQVKNSSTAVAIGFSNTSSAGTAAGAAADMLTITSLSVGADGNLVTGTVTRWSVLTTESLANGGTQVALADISKAQVGDVVSISDGTTSVNVHVRAINLTTKRIQFKAVVVSLTIASGATAKTASSHRAKTTLALSGLSGDTTITVTSTSQMRVGTLLSIDDGTTLIFRTVTKVNGKAVTLNASLGAGIASGTPVVTQSFDLVVQHAGTVVDQPHTFLSFSPTDEVDYVETRLSGNNNESTYIEVADLAASISDDLLNRLAAVSNVLLLGGDDGAMPGDNEYLGSASFPKTGLHLLDNVTTMSIVAIPGITTQAVQGGLCDYADLRKNCIAVCDTPLADDDPLEAADFRNNVLNRDTSYAALYYPWLQIRDRHAPVGTKNPRKYAPPSGAMCGLYAKVDNDFNVATAPANFPLAEVFGLSHLTEDGEHDILNPIGVNVIRSYPGQGIIPMGARTLSRTEDGRHWINVRRLFLFVESSIQPTLRRFLMRANDPATYRQITRLLKGFLKGIWREKMLFPSTSFEDAQFVKCDTENNPKELRTQGKLVAEIGLNPLVPAEKITLRVGVFDGGSSTEESVGNR